MSEAFQKAVDVLHVSAFVFEKGGNSKDLREGLFLSDV